MDPTQVCAGGEAHFVLGRGFMAFLFWSGRLKKGYKSGLKNFCIFIFLIVVQDEPYKIPVIYFSERFSAIIFKKCLNDSCQKEKPSRSMLSSEGRN